MHGSSPHLDQSMNFPNACPQLTTDDHFLAANISPLTSITFIEIIVLNTRTTQFNLVHAEKLSNTWVCGSNNNFRIRQPAKLCKHKLLNGYKTVNVSFMLYLNIVVRYEREIISQTTHYSPL